MILSVISIQKNSHPTDFGIPGLVGYTSGSTLYAFLLHAGRAYILTSMQSDSSPPFAERERAFLDTIRRFKFREMNEIPKERGLCIPYGFIPDDGTSKFRMKVSMRYADRPGVIYTMDTGVVGKLGVIGPEPALFKATARAATGLMAGTLGDGVKRTLKTVGPHRAKIGELTASQGGVVLNAADKGQPVLPTYSVYTGYPGYWDSQVLPYITVDMRSFTKLQDKTLPSNPPPFEESMSRLNALLQSIRLRPTSELMPELVEPKQGR